MPACSEHLVPICLVCQRVLSDQALPEELIDEHCRLIVDRSVETGWTSVGVDFQIQDLSLIIAGYLKYFYFCDFQVFLLT